MSTLTIKFILFSVICSLPSFVAAQNILPDPPTGIIKLNAYQSPKLELTDIDNEKFNLSSSKGHWVFVHFWASWCGPCRKEMPEIQKMWRTLEKEGLKMALINTAEDEDTVFSFVSVYAPDMRALMDRDGLETEKWKPRGLPATYLVDRNGQVQYQALGGRKWNTKKYLTFLRQLLKTK